jgi:leucine dehydrogenase
MNAPAGTQDATHELVRWTRDDASGLRAVVAIHSTRRGPAFGGCRMWHYADEAAARHDALRLSEGMSLKNALADLPFGGGKAVIMAPPQALQRRLAFSAFGRFVDSLEGRYITAEDVGVTTDDMRIVREHTPYVSGLPRPGAYGGDPSPMTALGVYVGIREAVRRHLRRATLAGTTVAVQGLGAVGSALCELLAADGCKLVVADINPARVEQMRRRFGAQPAGVDEIPRVQADVFAPCALGAVLDRTSIPALQVAIVAGAANNQLATAADGDQLHARGILYLPDFLINAGGIISVAREYLGNAQKEAVQSEVLRIGQRVAELLERAEGKALSTAQIAEQWARSKINAEAVAD